MFTILTLSVDGCKFIALRRADLNMKKMPQCISVEGWASSYSQFIQPVPTASS
jgi:hypothetical protein